MSSSDIKRWWLTDREGDDRQESTDVPLMMTNYAYPPQHAPPCTWIIHQALEARLKELGVLKEEQRKTLKSATLQHQAQRKDLDREKQQVSGTP